MAEGVGFALGTILGELQNVEKQSSDSDTIHVSHQTPSGVCADDLSSRFPRTSELFAPKTPDEILDMIPHTPTELNSPRTPDGPVPITPPLPESPDWSPLAQTRTRILRQLHAASLMVWMRTTLTVSRFMIRTPQTVPVNLRFEAPWK